MCCAGGRLPGEVVGAGQVECGGLPDGPGGGGGGRAGLGAVGALVLGEPADFAAVGGAVGLDVAGEAEGGGPVHVLRHLCVCEGKVEVRVSEVVVRSG